MRGISFNPNNSIYTQLNAHLKKQEQKFEENLQSGGIANKLETIKKHAPVPRISETIKSRNEQQQKELPERVRQNKMYSETTNTGKVVNVAL